MFGPLARVCVFNVCFVEFMAFLEPTEMTKVKSRTVSECAISPDNGAKYFERSPQPCE